MIRLGLCCIFVDAPIKFRRTTATYQSKFSLAKQRRHLADLCMYNAHELLKALTYCHAAGIGDFRINSQILPLITHPRQGYDIHDLPDYRKIVAVYRQCGEFARQHDIRTSFPRPICGDRFTPLCRAQKVCCRIGMSGHGRRLGGRRCDQHPRGRGLR